jgi:hypothetical protein
MGLGGVSGCARRSEDRGSIQQSSSGASRGRRACRSLIPRRHPHFDSDMGADLARVVIDEVPDAVMRNSPQFRPLPKGANRWFLACREDPARPQTLYVRELSSCHCFVLCFHAHGCASTEVASRVNPAQCSIYLRPPARVQRIGIGPALHFAVGQSLGPPNARRFGAAYIVSAAKIASVFDEAGLGFKKTAKE